MVDVKYLYQNIMLVIFLIEVKLRGFRMKKFLERSSIVSPYENYAIGLVSASISSLFLCPLRGGTVFAQENVAVHYKYVTDTS